MLDTGEGEFRTVSQIHYFLSTIVLTLAITFWAARRNSGHASLYAAEGRISAPQNGLAIAGDFLSAGTVLGIV
jgi:cation/acetate symporter